jgi:hypothetical protein
MFARFRHWTSLQPNSGRLPCIPLGPNVSGYSPTVAPSFKIDGPDCRAGPTGSMCRCIGCGLQHDTRRSRSHSYAGLTVRTIRGLIFFCRVVLPVVRAVFLVVADQAQGAPCNVDNRYASTGSCLVQCGRGAERISTTSMYRQHFEWDNHGSVDRP